MPTTLFGLQRQVAAKKPCARRSERPASLASLPPEIRLQIYKNTWDSRTIVLCYEETLECPGKPPLSYRYVPVASHGLGRMMAVERNQRNLYKSCPEYQTESGTRFDAPEQGIHTFTTYTPASTPRISTLAINKDSRAMTLGYYKPAFAMHSMHLYTGCFHLDSENFHYNTYVYFNFSLDVLVIPFPSLWDFSVVDRLRFYDLSQLRYVQFRIWDHSQIITTGLHITNVKEFPPQCEPIHIFKIDMGPVSTLRKMHPFGKPNTQPKRQAYVQQFEAWKERMNCAALQGTVEGETDTATEIEEECELDDEEDTGHMNNSDWSPTPLYYDFSPSLPTHGEIDDINLERGSQLPLKWICNRIQEVSCTFGEPLAKSARKFVVARLVSADEAESTATEMTEIVNRSQRRIDGIAKSTQDSTDADAAEKTFYADWHRKMICPAVPDDAKEKYTSEPKNFKDKRPHLQIEVGPDCKGYLLRRELFEWLVSWFPLKEGSDEKGPDRQDGFHWPVPRTADGWMRVIQTPRKFEVMRVKKHYGSTGANKRKQEQSNP